VRLLNPEVRIETSTLCNSNCIICPRDKFTRPKMTMDNQHFEKLVEQAHDLGAKIISVFGFGESLMDRDIAWKVNCCTAHGLKTNITTNASRLNRGLAMSLLIAGLSRIQFSVHGLKGTYNKVHRGLNFSTTFRNIINFLELNKTLFNGQCETSTVINPMHGETIEEIARLWEDRVDYFEIWKPHNWTDGKDFRKVERKKKTCGRPFTGPLQINCDGKMMVCCFDYNAKLTVGCTRRNKIEDIVKGDQYNAIRERHSSGDLKGLVCEKCDQLNEYPESPLLYSTRDPECLINRTNALKFEVKED